MIMKKLQLTAVLLILSLLLPLTAYASADLTSEEVPPPAHTTNPEKIVLLSSNEIRCGQTVTFTLRLFSNSARAIQGSISYDPALLTLTECKTLAEGWSLNFSQENGTLQFLGLDTMSIGAPLELDLCTFTFKVTELANVSELSIALAPAIVYDGIAELTYPEDTFTFPLLPPLSTDCALESLDVQGGTLSPAFSADVTEYNVTLPYSVHRAEITAIAHDRDNATVKISDTALAVGENKVTITVLSPSGLQKIYTVTITRSPDPNYTPSADNRILSLHLSEGLLFPAFSPDVTVYTVYMVQGQSVTLTPTPVELASAGALTIPSDSTEAEYTISCRAENGETRLYTFRVILLDPPAQSEQTQQGTQPEEKDPSSHFRKLSLAIAIATGATLFFLGFIFGVVLFGKRKKAAAPGEAIVSDAPLDQPSDSENTTE